MFCESRLSIILNVRKLIDFDSKPWMDALMVTPRHAVHTQWNEAVFHKHYRSTGNRLFICPAENQIQGHRLTLAKCYGVVAR
jgi:hypothetical protein